jgi:Flp pilus assembly protein CpaB
LGCPPWCTEFHSPGTAELLHQHSLVDTWSREDEAGGAEIGLAIRSFADTHGVDTPTVDIHVATDDAETVIELTPGDAVTFALSILRLARLAGAEVPAA